MSFQQEGRKSSCSVNSQLSMTTCQSSFSAGPSMAGPIETAQLRQIITDRPKTTEQTIDDIGAPSRVLDSFRNES